MFAFRRFLDPTEHLDRATDGGARKVLAEEDLEDDDLAAGEGGLVMAADLQVTNCRSRDTNLAGGHSALGQDDDDDADNGIEMQSSLAETATSPTRV